MFPVVGFTQESSQARDDLWWTAQRCSRVLKVIGSAHVVVAVHLVHWGTLQLPGSVRIHSSSTSSAELLLNDCVAKSIRGWLPLHLTATVSA